MEELLSIFTLIVGAGIALSLSKRLGLLAPISVYAWFLVMDIGLFFIIHFNQLSRSDYTFTAMPWPDFSKVFANTTFVYIFLLCLSYISSIGVKKKNISNQSNVSNIISTKFISKNPTFQFILLIFIIFTLFIEIYHFLELDKAVFWSNNVYLWLVNPATAGFSTSFGRLAHLFFPFLGLILVALASYFWVRRSLVLSSFIFFLSIYPFLIVFAQNSRWAPLYPAASIIIFVIFSKRKSSKLVAITMMGLFSFILFLKVLVGRNTSYQGISGTWEIFRIVLLEGEMDHFLRSIPFNIFQGAQNFANTLIIAPSYPTTYKVLSFSPTISLIDNFSAQLKYNINITPVVPINAFSEAYHFGLIFWFFLLAIFFIWLRYVTIAHLKKGILASVVSLVSYWIIFYINQYPVRNSMRFIYLTIFITLLFVINRNSRSKNIT